MAALAGTYSHITIPTINHTISHEVSQTGTTVRVRIKTSTSAVSGANYFGFNFRCNIFLNGSQVLTNGLVKDNLPNRWTSPIVNYWPSSTGWYTVSNVNSNELTARVTVTTNSPTDSTLNTGNRTIALQNAGSASIGLSSGDIATADMFIWNNGRYDTVYVNLKTSQKMAEI